MGTERKWARWAQRKSGCLRGKRAFLPPDFESVKTRNVWADVRWDVNETGGQCRRTQEEKTFCFFVQSTTNHCVSFGCSVSGFHHAECSSGGPKSSTACFLFLRRPPPVYMEAFNLLVYRTLSTKPQKSYFSKKKKINKPKKKKKTTGLLYTTKNVKREK